MYVVGKLLSKMENKRCEAQDEAYLLLPGEA